MSDYKKLLKNKKFVYLWLSQIFSNVTINILNFTFLFRIYQHTGSTIATSMLWVSYAMPALIIGPFGAVSADIIDRKKVLSMTNLLQAAVVFLYALIFVENIYISYGVAMIYSILNQFNDPAEISSVPYLLEKKNLASANSLFFITQQAAVVVGFGFAGFLVKILGYSNTLYICSFLLFFAYISASKLPSMKNGKSKKEKIESSLYSFFISIWEGYKYIKNNNSVLAPLALLLSLNTCLTITVVNAPALGKEVFNIPFEYVGILMAIPAGSGAALGALIVPRLLKNGYRKIKLLYISYFLLTLSLFIIIFLIPQLNILLKLTVSVSAIFLIGNAFIGALIPTQTFLQQNIPHNLMGRVFGNYQFLSVVVSIFPIIFFGTITEIFGIKVLLFVISMVSLFFLYFLKKHADLFIKSGFTFSKKTNV